MGKKTFRVKQEGRGRGVQGETPAACRRDSFLGFLSPYGFKTIQHFRQVTTISHGHISSRLTQLGIVLIKFLIAAYASSDCLDEFLHVFILAVPYLPRYTVLDNTTRDTNTHVRAYPTGADVYILSIL